MDNNLSFLIQCDKQLNITKNFWYQPAYLISPYQKKFADLFTPGDGERISQLTKQACSRREILLCDDSFELVSPRIKMNLCMMSMDDQVLVCGMNPSLLPTDEVVFFVKDLLFQFMKVIRSSGTELLTENEKMVRSQFEQIQQLNNNLVNMQRELKKSNSKLNQLNRDLNNRLVKDALTGLVSRYQYRTEIELAIAEEPEKQGIFTFIDVDNFKHINDTYGHGAGDEFLKTFARRLNQLPFDNLICMRIAGDEFGLYLHGYNSAGQKEINDIWQGIHKMVLKEPITFEEITMNVFCSAGMSVYGKDTRDVYDLIEYADFAMYEAKNAGKNVFRAFDMDLYKGKKTTML